MTSAIDVQLILCDSAVSDPNGKVHMLGAGWSITGSPSAPHAVVVLMGIPWDKANQKIPIKLQLLDDDGHSVTVPGPTGVSTPVQHVGEFEIGHPPGLPHGITLDAGFSLAVPALPIKPGRYQWRLELGDQTVARSFTAHSGVIRPQIQ